MAADASSLGPTDWRLDQVSTRGGVTVPVRATARRPSWPALPAAVRDRICLAAVGQVVQAESTGTGFTPGFASRLTLADGRRIFVKAASSGYDATHGWALTGAYREEIRKLSMLPGGIGAPALLWSIDDDIDGERWVVVGLEYVAGRPPRRPWRPDELWLVTARLAEIAPRLALAPPGLEVGTFADDFGEWGAWLSYVRERDGESHWLDAVAELAAESIERCGGEGLAHLDLRDDNILIDDSRQVWMCDWNFPLMAAPWIDLITVLLSAAGDGLDVEPIVAGHPLTRDVDPRSVDALLANLWLYFAKAMDQPVPEFCPHLRDHQRWYAEATADWLSRRLLRDWAR
jgi:hypothetical protein